MSLRLWCAALLFAVPASAQTAEDLFNDRILHEIHLDVHPRDWQQLKDSFLENTFFAADLHWKSGGRDVSVRQAAIRSRGTGSRSPIKPGLLVDFQRYNNQQRFLGLSSLVLRNNTQDASMLHERLAFGLMSRMGFHVPRLSHTRLFVNGEYLGLYSIVETIDEDFLQDRYGDAGGYLYRYNFDGGDPPYLFEYRGADPALYSPDPFEPETRQSTPSPRQLEEMIRTMNQAADSEFETATSKYLDWNEILSYIAVEAYLAESDGFIGDFGLNNFYLYRFADSDLFHIIPWDRSQSFDSPDRSVWSNIETNVLTRRAVAMPALRDIFVTGLENASMAAGGPGGWLQAETEFAYAQIRQAALEDGNKQCYGSMGDLVHCSNQQFEDAVEALIDFARFRNATVDTQIAELLGVPSGGQKLFNFSSPGGVSFSTGPLAEEPLLGYAVIQTPAGTPPPAGLAFIQLHQNGIFVSEAPVAAVAPLTRGRISVETGAGVVTGLALVNAEPIDASVQFHFTDAQGRDFGHGLMIIPANGQFVGYLHDPPVAAAPPAGGSFTFSSQVPVAAFAVRGITNERSEFLIASLPVADLSVRNAQSILPLFLEGMGWNSELVLLNPSGNTLTGTLDFNAGGVRWPVPYSIPPGGVFRTNAAAPASGLLSGWVSVGFEGEPPVAYAVLLFTTEGIRTTQTVVPATEPAAAVRTHSESLSAGSLEEGFVIVNSSNTPVVALFEFTPFSSEIAPATGYLSIAGESQRTFLVSEVTGFESIGDLEGTIRISAPTASISAVGIRQRHNHRENLILTAVPVTGETSDPPPASIYFPLLLHSREYGTKFVLYSVGRVQNLTGTVSFRRPDGSVLDLKLNP